jgi:hypothetical protein
MHQLVRDLMTSHLVDRYLELLEKDENTKADEVDDAVDSLQDDEPNRSILRRLFSEEYDEILSELAARRNELTATEQKCWRETRTLESKKLLAFLELLG